LSWGYWLIIGGESGRSIVKGKTKGPGGEGGKEIRDGRGGAVHLQKVTQFNNADAISGENAGKLGHIEAAKTVTAHNLLVKPISPH